MLLGHTEGEISYIGQEIRAAFGLVPAGQNLVLFLSWRAITLTHHNGLIILVWVLTGGIANAIRVFPEIKEFGTSPDE